MAAEPSLSRAPMVFDGPPPLCSWARPRASWAPRREPPASAHVSSEDPCTLMSPEKGKKDPGQSLEVDAKHVIDAPLSVARLCQRDCRSRAGERVTGRGGGGGAVMLGKISPEEVPPLL